MKHASVHVAAEGPTYIEAKMMRMKGHAIHDAAQYVPRELVDYWQRRDPIARMEKYLIAKEMAERAGKRPVDRRC